jgi:hypothetical protein
VVASDAALSCMRCDEGTTQVDWPSIQSLGRERSYTPTCVFERDLSRGCEPRSHTTGFEAMTGDTTTHVVIHRTGLHLHCDTVRLCWVFNDSYDSNLQITSFIWYCSEDDGLFNDMTQLVKMGSEIKR